MGLLDAVGAGIAEAGGAIASMGMEQIKAAIEADREARLKEAQSQLDLTKRERDKADAEAERKRVSEYMKPEVSQSNGLLAENAGLNDDESIGADESVGRDVQNRERPVTDAVAAKRARDAGDLKAAADIGKLDDKDVANALKLEIAKGNMENAIRLANVRGEFGLVLGELKAASKGGSDKATEMMRNWEFLKKQGFNDKEVAEKLLDGKVGEYATISTESYDANGNKITRTEKVKSGGKDTPVPTRKVVKFGELNK